MIYINDDYLFDYGMPYLHHSGLRCRLYCRLLLVDLVATSIYLQNMATSMLTTRLNTQLHQLRLEVLSFALGIVG